MLALVAEVAEFESRSFRTAIAHATAAAWRSWRLWRARVGQASRPRAFWSHDEGVAYRHGLAERRARAALLKRDL